MTPSLFSTIGYVSVGLWGVALVLVVLHHVRRPRKWLCHVALVVAIAAFVAAKVNSDNYVNRIQLDKSAEIAAAEARQEAARQAALEAREGEVADVRFAEDSFQDRLDQGGMDEADRKYMESIQEPGWKKAKKQRSSQSQQDDSLEGMLDTEAPEEGVASEFTEKAEEAEPIVMSAERMRTANGLDAANRKITRYLILLITILLIIDYLRRANIYEEAYFPLPLPSRWLTGLTPAPPIVERKSPRRDLAGEAAWVTRRGDAFLCVSTDSDAIAKIPESLPKLPAGMGSVDVLRVSDAITDDFVFESLWYGRSSFVVDSQERAERMAKRFLELMAERRGTRAVVGQTVHVLWDLGTPMPETLKGEFSGLAKATGLSVIQLQS